MFQKILDFFGAIWRYMLSHKIKSSVALIILVVAAYYGYNYFFGSTETETRYILTSVTKGTISTTVDGTGQVESANEKTISAKTSGEITYLSSNLKIGNSITKGALIAQIDTSNAQASIKSAEQTLENAKDSLETAQIDLDDLIGDDESNPQVKQDAEEDLAESYEDGYNTVSSVYLDLPNVMKNLEDIINGNDYSNYQENIDYYTYGANAYNENALTYKSALETSYSAADTAYDTSFLNYKTSSIYSDTETIDSLITETYNTTKLISQAIKDAINLIQFYEDTLTDHSIDIPSKADTHISNLSSYSSTVNSDVSSLYSTTTTIKNNKDAVENSTDDIRTAKLTVKSKQQAVENAEDDLADAKDDLNDCYIYATLSGVVSAVDIEVGDNVSSGTSIATIITTSKIASITLSETDIANVQVGDTATLTFDAIEDLTVEGTVSEVDVSGSASSGVVSYGMEIAFDTDNESIKSGMSVNATITTNSKANVLILSTSAVETANDGTYYVQVLSDTYDLTDRSVSIKGVTSATTPSNKTVTIGLSDDTNTEITSGLEEGDQVVLRISSSDTSSSSSSSSSSKSGSSSSILNTGGGGGMPSGGGPGGM